MLALLVAAPISGDVRVFTNSMNIRGVGVGVELYLRRNERQGPR